MAKRKPLVCQHLEDISGTALERYQDVIKKYVRGRHGVYALYRRERLYYVGLASNLRTRLKHHLKDKHKGKWDRFSVYLTIGDSHLKELESLVLRIVKPKGNAQRGKFAKAEDMKRRLRGDLSVYYRGVVDELLGKRRRKRADDGGARPRTKEKGAPQVPLAGRVPRPFTIRVRYKGKRHTARVRRDGRIRMASKLYVSPSKAGEAIRGRATNGWTFWLFERAPGDWVRLAEFKKQQ